MFRDISQVLAAPINRAVLQAASISETLVTSTRLYGATTQKRAIFKQFHSLRLDILTAVKIFWVVTQCSVGGGHQ
jgi:hypothetical protein